MGILHDRKVQGAYTPKKFNCRFYIPRARRDSQPIRIDQESVGVVAFLEDIAD